MGTAGPTRARLPSSRAAPAVVFRHVQLSAVPARVYRLHTPIIQKGMSHLPFGSHMVANL